MIARSIRLMFTGAPQAFEVVIDTHNVPDSVEEVIVNCTQDQLQNSIIESAKKLTVHLYGVAEKLMDSCIAAGLGQQFADYMDLLETRRNAPVPKVFQGVLRKRITRLVTLLRKNIEDPKSMFKGYLVGTSNGLVLTLWMHLEEFSLFNDVVEAAQPQAALPAPAVTQPQVVLIQPTQKPVVVCRSANTNKQELVIGSLVLKVSNTTINPSDKTSARCVTTALAQRFARR